MIFRSGLASLFPVLAVICFAPNAFGQELLDQTHQQFGASLGLSDEFQRAQTFRVGITGSFSRIELPIGRQPNNPDTSTLTVDLRPVEPGGAPVADNASALGSVTIAAMNFPVSGPVSFDFGSQAIPVTANQVLAFTLVANGASFFQPSASFGWSGIEDSNSYPNGEAYMRSSPSSSWNTFPVTGFDGRFSTYVTLSEPEELAAGTSALTVLGLLAWIRSRRVGR